MRGESAAAEGEQRERRGKVRRGRTRAGRESGGEEDLLQLCDRLRHKGYEMTASSLHPLPVQPRGFIYGY